MDGYPRACFDRLFAMEVTMHNRRKLLGTILASVGVIFLPLPREVALAVMKAGPEHRSVVDVLASDPRMGLAESEGRIAGTYLRRVGEWETELDEPAWGFRIRRNDSLVLDAPLKEQLVSVGDIVSVSIRFA